MASGTLGQADLSAATNTILYTVPSGKISTFTVNICNRNSLPISVRIAIAATGTPSNSEYIEYDALIPSNGVLERTGLVATASKNIVVYTSTATCSANVYGYEE